MLHKYDIESWIFIYIVCVEILFYRFVDIIQLFSCDEGLEIIYVIDDFYFDKHNIAVVFDNTIYLSATYSVVLFTRSVAFIYIIAHDECFACIADRFFVHTYYM